MRASLSLLLAAAALTLAGCKQTPPKLPAAQVRLVVAPVGSFADRLVQEYARVSTTLDVRVVLSSAPAFDVIERGEADVTLTTADAAYFAYRPVPGGSPHPSLRALASLQAVPMHFIVRTGSGIRSPADLRGRRVGVTTTPIADLLFKALKLEGAFTPWALSLPDVMEIFERGEVDAVFAAGYYPSRLLAPAIGDHGSLLPIHGPEVDRLRESYPFVRLVTIPAHTYDGQEEPVHTIGAELLFVCRSTMTDSVAHDLTQGLFAALPVLAAHFPVLRTLDVRHASATPIPLHEGAARYYRETELLP